MLGCKFEEKYRSNFSSPLLANLRLAELIKVTMNQIFRGFCINRFSIVTLHYISVAVPILASNSRRYSYSKNDSPTQRCRESATLRINDTRSRRLSDSTIRGRRLSASLIRGVDNSQHHRYGESAESLRLPASLSRRVTDSKYC